LLLRFGNCFSLMGSRPHQAGWNRLRRAPDTDGTAQQENGPFPKLNSMPDALQGVKDGTPKNR